MKCQVLFSLKKKSSPRATTAHLSTDFFFFFFLFGFYSPFKNISLISKVGENRRTRRKTTWPSVSRTYLSTDTYIHILNYNSSWKMHYFTIFPFKSPRDQICPKIGQDQPKVIILTNLVVFSHLILQAKFHGNQPSGTGKKDLDLFRLIPYMDRAAILVMRSGPFNL